MFTNEKQKKDLKDDVRKKDAGGNANSPNVTGIPANMKDQFENLSGFSFDDVRVHYNSDKPAQLQALAYTQGNQVYMGPGQERHLGHELGHVVQQKQGRVQPTVQLMGISVNDNSALEHEADYMASISSSVPLPQNDRLTPAQRKTHPIVQMITDISYKYKKYRYNECVLNPNPALYGPSKYLLTPNVKEENVGAETTATLDPADIRYGSGTGGGEQDALMWHLNTKYGQSNGNFVKGHLLNHDLGGLSVPENLFPITHRANSNHSSKVEQGVKKLLAADNLIHYTIKVDSAFNDCGNPLAGSNKDTFECTIYWKDASSTVNQYTEKIESVLSSDGSPSGGLVYSELFKSGVPSAKGNPWEHEAIGKREDYQRRSAIMAIPSTDPTAWQYGAYHDYNTFTNAYATPKIYANVSMAP